jgi:hypothetical protein
MITIKKKDLERLIYKLYLLLINIDEIIIENVKIIYSD